MAKQFNKELHDDIIRLKEFRKNNNDEAFQKTLRAVAAMHNISISTVYREMKKERPGSYSNNRNPAMVKITIAELDKLAELTLEGKDDRQMIYCLSEFKDFQYTPQRLRQAKYKLYRRAHAMNDPKAKVIYHVYDPKLIDGLKISAVSEVREDGKTSGAGEASDDLPAYEGDASRFFYELAKVSDAEPDRKLKIEAGGKVLYVHNSSARDSLALLAASAANGGKSVEECSRISLAALLRRQMDYAARRGYITPGELKQLAQIQRSIQQIYAGEGRGSERTFTFDELMHVVNYYSPSAGRETVANVIASHPFINRKVNLPYPKPQPPVPSAADSGGAAIDV